MMNHLTPAWCISRKIRHVLFASAKDSEEEEVEEPDFIPPPPSVVRDLERTRNLKFPSKSRNQMNSGSSSSRKLKGGGELP